MQWLKIKKFVTRKTLSPRQPNNCRYVLQTILIVIFVVCTRFMLCGNVGLSFYHDIKLNEMNLN